MKQTIVDPFVPVRRIQQEIPVAKPKIISRQTPKTSEQPSKKKTRLPRIRFSRLGHKGQIIIITVAAAAAGLLMTIPGAGEFVVGVYAILAIVLKIKSKVTLILTAFMFIFVVLLLLLEPSKILAMAFATYAFLMLVIGLVTLVIEMKNAPMLPIKPGLTLHRDE